MPNPPAGPTHLDEAFGLAQLVSADRRDAVRILERAIDDAGPGRASRFPLLRSVVAVADLFPVESRIDAPELADGAGYEADAEVVPDAPVEAPNDDSIGTPSLASRLAGREILRRVIPAAVARMQPADRALAWLDACQLSNPADLGAVLGLSAPESLERLVACRTHLADALLAACPDSERPMAAAALTTSEPGELVRIGLRPLLEPAPAALRDRAAPPPPAPSSSSSAGTRRRLAGFARVVTFVVLAAAVGWSIRSFRPNPDARPEPVSSDLVGLAVDAAESTRPTFRATGAEQAEVFIHDRVGWRVVVPSIEGSRLEGVGVHDFDGATETPALVYDGSRRVVLFVFPYAYLDRVSPALVIGRDVLDQVADDGRFAVVDAGRQRALVFRNRDDVYVAVTSGDPVALRDALSFPD